MVTPKNLKTVGACSLGVLLPIFVGYFELRAFRNEDHTLILIMTRYSTKLTVISVFGFPVAK